MGSALSVPSDGSGHYLGAVICYAPMTGLLYGIHQLCTVYKGYFHDLLSAPFVGLEWFQLISLKMILR